MGGRPNSEHVTATHCNGTFALRARMNPKLISGDRNLRQRQRKRMGTAVRQQRQPSAEPSLRECRSGTTPERCQNDARTTSPATPSPNIPQSRTQAGKQAGRQAGRTKTQIPTVYGGPDAMSPTSYDSAQPAGTQALRFIHEVWNRHHDNPRQSHAGTQRATSFRHPPRVRATTK